MTDAMQRAKLIVDRTETRLEAILQAVPPLDPDNQHWLESDCSESYCRRCIKIARGAEFDLGAPIVETPWYNRDAWLEAFYEGISTGEDMNEDSPASCAICFQTLYYILTDYGVECEIEHFREALLTSVDDEVSYSLDRMMLNIYDGSPRNQILGVAIAVNRAWRLIACDDYAPSEADGYLAIDHGINDDEKDDWSDVDPKPRS